MTTFSTAAVAAESRSHRAHGATAPRGWRLEERLAMSLRPQLPSRLVITEGRAWITLGLSRRGLGRGSESGDFMLCAGESLRVPAGARLVMEPWQPIGAAGPVRFDWQADAPVPAVSPWREAFVREVVAPSRDVGQALWQVGAAVGRLARGLFGYGGLLVTGRGRPLAAACDPRTH